MRFESVEQWLKWQETLHPSEIELGLDRVAEIYQKLHIDFLDTPIVSIAGTNGKGSCAAFLTNILSQAGYRVGQYTSPHLLRYNERIRINQQAISDLELINAFSAVDHARDGSQLTYFEFGTLAAFSYFAKSECDVLVLEVGLGGRLDAVNIVEPTISLITSIGIDHTDWLGVDRESIGQEKAGIMRRGVPVVCGDNSPPESLVGHANAIGAKGYYINRDFTADSTEQSWSWQCDGKRIDDLPIPPLIGDAQISNAACVLMVIELLELHVSAEHVVTGIEVTALPGRFQILHTVPLQIVDVAHNVQAVENLANSLSNLANRNVVNFSSGKNVQTHAVFSILARKDMESIVQAISDQIDIWHIAPLQHSAGVTLDEMRKRMNSLEKIPELRCYENVASAWQSAVSSAGDLDRVVGFGSFYTVAEILAVEQNYSV